MEEYRYECGSVAGFVQRAVVLSQRGYRYFVADEVPERKDRGAVDAKMLSKYGVALTRRQRTYRKSKGLPNGHYFRVARRWVLMATSRAFFLEIDRNERVKDLRESPLRVGGYSLSLRNDGAAKCGGLRRLRASVRLDERTRRELRSVLEDGATHRTTEEMALRFWKESNRWQVYAPVYRQIRGILRRVNESRKTAGLAPVPLTCLRLHRVFPQQFFSPAMKVESKLERSRAGVD